MVFISLACRYSCLIPTCVCDLLKAFVPWWCGVVSSIFHPCAAPKVLLASPIMVSLMYVGDLPSAALSSLGSLEFPFGGPESIQHLLHSSSCDGRSPMAYRHSCGHFETTGLFFFSTMLRRLSNTSKFNHRLYLPGYRYFPMNRNVSYDMQHRDSPNTIMPLEKYTGTQVRVPLLLRIPRRTES